MPKTGFILLIIGILYSLNPAIAVDLNGFASIGAGRTTRSDAKFIEYSDNWTLRSDTTFGVQLQDQLTDTCSWTAQVVSNGFSFNDTNDYEPSLDWLFLSYQHAPNMRFRLGRLRTPLFLFSDSLAVGYAHTFVRPPISVYLPVLEPLSNYEGGDISVAQDLGDYDLELSFFGGSMHHTFNDFDLNVNPIFGFISRIRRANYLMRYGIIFARTDVSSRSFTQLGNAFSQFSFIDPIFDELNESHATNNQWFRYYALGIQWDTNTWSVISEFNVTQSGENGFVNNSHNGYIMLSRQFDSITPYAGISYNKNRLGSELTNLVLESQSRVPIGAIPQLDTLRATALDLYQSFNTSSYSFTLGSRYDIRPNIALKLEVEHFDNSALLIRAPTQYRDKSFTAFAVILDMVF